MRILSPTGLARASARRPWLVVSLWIVLLVLAGLAAPLMDGNLTSEAIFTNDPESVEGFELLEDRLRGPRPMTETVIVHSETMTVDDPAFQDEVEAVRAALAGMPDIVRSSTDYYQTSDPALVSEDRRTTIVPVTLAGDLDEAIEHGGDFVDAVTGAVANPAIEVMTVGDASINDETNRITEEDLRRGEGIGIPIALVILVLVFGALVAAGLPLALGIAAIVVAIGLTAVISTGFEQSILVTNMITMIGLAVGIDYALFVVDRYREERRRGHPRAEAIALAGGTAGRTVLFSGLTVVLSLLGLFLVPVNIFRSLSLGAVLVVLVAVAATLTLIPALLSLLGDKIDWPRRRRYDATAAAADIGNATGIWARLTRAVMRRPVASAALAGGLLVVLALPAFGIEDGLLGISALPEDSESRRAYEVLSRDFAAGLIAPVEVVVNGPAADPSVDAGIDKLVAALAADPTFGPATVTTNPAGDLTLVSAPLTVAPDEQAAYDAVERLRDDAVPTAFAGTGAEVFVTGQSASNLDFFATKDRATPLVCAFVLGLSFLLLMVAFRSLVVPVKAIVLNLLSVGAAYGLLVLVFQEGVGNGLFGFQQTPAIEAWLPLFLFAVLFGLSMDYHVFLLSRIRERYDQTGDNREAVAYGLRSTARLITGAAAIMVVVFSGFAAGGLVPLQQFGFGLAVAIFLDATVVRTVLVPATMALLGDRNWYLPRWLQKLPDLRIEAPDVPSPLPVPAVVPAARSVSGDD